MNRYKFLLFFVILLLPRFLKGGAPGSNAVNLYSYQLHIDLRDFDNHILHATARIKIYAQTDRVNHISFNLQKLTVDSVKQNEETVPFSYNDSLLTTRFKHTLNKGDSAILLIYYHGTPQHLPGDFGGFYWDSQYAYNIGVSFATLPHSYGRAWFPCFDNFTVRSRYEYFITTRLTDKAFCNGLLLGSKTDSTGITWHWKLNEYIPAYLASVAVAPYQTLNDTIHGINGVVPVAIAALPGDTAAVVACFRHLHQAFHIFEHYWGPYRWDRVGYCIVPFKAGAMEHATNIAFMQYYLNIYKENCEPTMAHELSHHWFGNLVTCATDSDMWLNEAWASYCESLFTEQLYGADSARLYRRNNHTKEVENAYKADGGYLPVGKVPAEHTYGSTVYEKGADVIQTLRYYLGDTVFFSCVKSYLDKYAFSSATTAQFCNYLSSCSGRDLTTFFNDWIMNPGYPHFSVGHTSVKHKRGKYEVSVSIVQRISHAPRLYTQVPVTISYFSRRMKRKDEVIFVSGANTVYTTTLNFKPAAIIPDFDENLAEAITRQWQVIKDTGLYEYDNANAAIQVQVVNDSALIWIGQNLLPPRTDNYAANGLCFANTGYWTVNGVFTPGLNAVGIFGYDGLFADTLKKGFIINEDSLLMMYRPDEVTGWRPVKQFYIDKGDSDSDQAGSIAVYPLLKGEYAIAARNSINCNPADSINQPVNNAKPLSTNYGYNLHYNARSKSLSIGFKKNTFDRVDISNHLGENLAELKIDRTLNRVTIPWHVSVNETYVVTLTTKTGNRISKKLTN